MDMTTLVLSLLIGIPLATWAAWRAEL